MVVLEACGVVVGPGIGALPDGGTVTIFPAPNIISFILLFPTMERSTTAALSESARNVLFAGSNIIRFPSVRVPWMMDRSLVFRRVNASPWITLISVLPQVSNIISPFPSTVEEDPQAVILTVLGASGASEITTPFNSLAASFIVTLGLVIPLGIIILPKV